MIRLENITKTYGFGDTVHTVIENLSLNIEKGEFVAIMGKSGCGKTTLLNILGTMDREYSGTYYLGGNNVSELSENKCCELRRSKIAVIYQDYNLIDDISVLNNIIISDVLSNKKIDLKSAKKNAALLGLEGKDKAVPANLSGGEKQRVAIARSLYQKAELILADEPTGNLDSQNSRLVIEKLGQVHKDQNVTIVMVTHDKDIAMAADRILYMRDGKISEVDYA